MRRLLLTVALAASAIAAGVTAPATPARASCRVPLHTRYGWEAEFGFRTTRTAAESLRTQATRVGFQNLAIEQLGCTRWTVALFGLKNRRQGRSLASEARRAGLQVTVACYPVLNMNGWEAVFGKFPKRTAAEALRTKAKRAGFAGLQINRDVCTHLYVVSLNGIKSLRVARSFRTEATKAGFAVTIQHH